MAVCCRFSGWGARDVDFVFQTDPGYERDAESEVKESFVGDGEKNEDGREGQEDDHQAVEVVVVGLKTVQEWH